MVMALLVVKRNRPVVGDRSPLILVATNGATRVPRRG